VTDTKLYVFAKPQKVTTLTCYMKISVKRALYHPFTDENSCAAIYFCGNHGTVLGLFD